MLYFPNRLQIHYLIKIIDAYSESALHLDKQYHEDIYWIVTEIQQYCEM